MNVNPLRIGNILVPMPIVQGGMGIGVSRSRLAAAVAKEGGIGVISAAQIGYDEWDFENNTFEANIRSLKKHIILAKEESKGGIIGVNIMVAMSNYKEFVKTAIEAGADLIISGAGLPTMLPDLTKGSKIKIAPIVSSLKSARVILKLWDKHYNTTADMIVVEGPKAGGHLGFKIEDINMSEDRFKEEVINILEETKKYEVKYNKHIPVIAGGGVYNGKDIVKYMTIGAHGVQMGTRFVATEECDASLAFKEAYVNSKKEDIVIVKSPVGMPGRALDNKFVKKSNNEKITVKKCYKCISHCNPKETPYCITEALINAVNGDLENGLIFCGDNCSKVDKIVKVSEMMKQLKMEILEN